jgi:hypothetical protein
MITSCPFPSDINYLSATGFRLSVDKLPELTFFCTQATLPNLSLSSIKMNTSLSPVNLSGDTIDIGMVNLTFIIDEKMENYKAVTRWITGLGFNKSHNQYMKFIRENGNEVSRGEQSDGVLEFLGSNNVAVATAKLINLTPVEIGDITMTSTDADVTYLSVNVSFAIDYYDWM